VAVLTGLLIGIAPAWQVSRCQPAFVLRRDERVMGGGTGALGKALIVTQIALSLVLLQGAGLFVRSLQSLRSFDPGFHKAGVLEVSLFPRPGGSKGLDLNAYRAQLIERIGSLPGVLSVSFSNLPVPANDKGWRDTVSAQPDVHVLATLAVVSPGFFRTLGIPVVSGRDFDNADDDLHPKVATIDSNLARKLSPGDSIRQRIRFGVHTEFQDLVVIGEARSARLIDLRDANLTVVYVPYFQHRGFGQRGNLFVRANHPDALAKTVDHETQSLGREYSTGAKTLEEMSEQALLHDRATAMLSSFFAGIALLLAGIGLFGLTSYTVARRTREVGIRMALGSPRAAILRMVLRETLLLTLAGVVIGLPCALTATRLVAHMLFGLSSDDPATLATVSSTLLLVGLIAGYLPARRAMKMDPMVALRHD
jgi:predicted permease